MKLKYGIDDLPRTAHLLLYGLEWLMIAIPVVLTSTFLARLHYDTPAQQILYAQKLFAIVGAGLILQVFFGHRLPLVLGPASVLIVGIMGSLAQPPQTVYTSILVGGAALFALAASGALGRLQRLFTPRIVVVILSLIAYTIAPVFLRLIFQETRHEGLALAFAPVCIAAMTLLQRLLWGVWRSTVVVWGLLAGSLAWYALTEFPRLGEASSQGAALFIAPLRFDAGTILAFLFCYIALTVNELGSVQSVGRMLDAGDMKRRSNRGTAMTGLLNVISGAFGVIGPVDYSLSPGVIASTGCASRYTLLPAGAGLLLIAFFPRLTALMAAIPSPVMGCVLLFLMASQLAAGFQMADATRAVRTFDEGFVVGLPILLAIFVSFAPAAALDRIPAMLRPLLGNGFVVGVIAVLLLEHLLYRHTKG